MEIEDGCVVTQMGLFIWNCNTIVIVPMTVLDYYGHHGGMHTFAFDDPNRTGNVLGRGCLEISFPLCIFPKKNLRILCRPKLDGQRHELGFGKSNMTLN